MCHQRGQRGLTLRVVVAFEYRKDHDMHGATHGALVLLPRAIRAGINAGSSPECNIEPDQKHGVNTSNTYRKPGEARSENVLLPKVRGLPEEGHGCTQPTLYPPLCSSCCTSRRRVAFVTWRADVAFGVQPIQIGSIDRPFLIDSVAHAFRSPTLDSHSVVAESYDFVLPTTRGLAFPLDLV